jgi:hypothetical protein
MIKSNTTQSEAHQRRLSLTALMDAQRQAVLKLHLRLRGCLSDEANVQMSPPPQSHIRRKQQLEKAFELRAQADAKLELLIEHFGGRP